MTIDYGNEYDEDGLPVGTLLKDMFNGAWLDAQVFPELQEIVPGILVEGFNILVGPPKVGKSWLVGNLAVAVAYGGKAVGSIDVIQRPVLYLALEDGQRRLQHRLRILCDGQPLPAALDMIVVVEPGQVEATIAEWLLSKQDSSPLVILDTLGKSRPQRRAGDDPYLADYKFGSQLKRLADDVPGSCLLAVHHTNKGDSGDFVDAVSGTQGIAGSADSILVLRRPRKSDEGTLAVTGRDVNEKEIALVIDGSGRWKLDGFDLDGAVERIEERKERGSQGDLTLDILAYAREHPVVTPKLVGAHFKIESKQAGVYLSRLVERGHLFKAGYGKYTHDKSSTTPTGPTPLDDGEEPT